MATTMLPQAASSIKALRNFIGDSQFSALCECVRGEEREFFRAKLADYAHLIATMPQTYEQDGMGDAAIVSLHYFTGGMDWYITERDSEPEQYQAFGFADLGYGGELGYISIEEITQHGAELDLYWQPCTLGEVKSRKA